MNSKAFELCEQVEDIFISYSHKDTDFVNTLNTRLSEQEYQTWGDWKIPGANDWEKEIHHAIEQTNTFIFVITQNSVESIECRKEADYAHQYGKRIIPILHQDIQNFDELHPAVKRHQFINFRAVDNFELSFQELTTAIQRDLEYARLHTRLLQRALEWDRGSRDESFLIRGKDLEIVRQKLVENASKEPKISPLQSEFVLTSGKAESHRYKLENQRQRLGLITTGSLLMLAVGGIFLWYQYRLAKVETLKAAIADAKTFAASGRRFDALKASLKATKIYNSSHLSLSDLKEEVTSILQYAASFLREQNQVQKHTTGIVDLVASPDGNYLASADDSGKIILWKSDGSSQSCFAGNQSIIYDLAFSPDSQVLASIGAEGIVRLCYTNGRPMTSLSHPHQKAKAWEIDFSPDGKFLASSDSQGRIYLRTADGDFWKELIGTSNRKAGVTYFSFSHDSKYLASAGIDGTVKIWTSDGRLLRSLNAHNGAVKHLDFSPQSDLLVTAGEDHKIRLWTATGIPIKTLEKHQDVVSRVVFSPDGQLIASTGYDKLVNLWQRDGTFFQNLGGLDAHRKIVESLKFSPDGRFIITASRDKSIKIWQRNGTFVESLIGHKDWVSEVVAIPHQKNLTLASVGLDKTIRFWRIDTSLVTKLLGHESTVMRLAFSHDGQYLASVDNGDILKIWQDGIESQRIKDKAIAIDFHPKRLHFVSGDSEGKIKLWEKDKNSWYSKILGKQSAAILQVRFSPNGEMVASAGNGGYANLWQLNVKKNISLKPPQGNNPTTVLDIRFSSDSKFVATAGDDGSVKLWQSNGKYVRELLGHQGAIYQVKFSPDGAFIVAASRDGRVQFWKLDGTQIALDGTEQHVSDVWDIDISPDSQLVASAGADNTVKLWNASGQLWRTLKGHEAEVRFVRFSPDGKFLASFSTDNTVKIWNRDGTLFKTLRDHNAAVMVGAFNTKGEMASAAEDGNILLWKSWQWTVQDLAKHTCLNIKNYMVQNPQDAHLCKP